MNKYLVTIEFRYYDKPKKEHESSYKNETITIGVFDDFDESCTEGNNALECLENRFKLHVFPGGNIAKKERFSRNGGAYGSKKTLITNLAYLKTPFDFYAKIETLKYTDINKTIDEVMEATERYKHFNNETE